MNKIRLLLSSFCQKKICVSYYNMCTILTAQFTCKRRGPLRLLVVLPFHFQRLLAKFACHSTHPFVLFEVLPHTDDELADDSFIAKTGCFPDLWLFFACARGTNSSSNEMKFQHPWTNNFIRIFDLFVSPLVNTQDLFVFVYVKFRLSSDDDPAACTGWKCLALVELARLSGSLSPAYCPILKLIGRCHWNHKAEVTPSLSWRHNEEFEIPALYALRGIHVHDVIHDVYPQPEGGQFYVVLFAMTAWDLPPPPEHYCH